MLPSGNHPLNPCRQRIVTSFVMIPTHFPCKLSTGFYPLTLHRGSGNTLLYTEESENALSVNNKCKPCTLGHQGLMFVSRAHSVSRSLNTLLQINQSAASSVALSSQMNTTTHSSCGYIPLISHSHDCPLTSLDGFASVKLSIHKYYSRY